MRTTLEERVAYLEGKVEEHSRAWEDFKDMIIHLDQKVDRFRDELSSRINALDQKFSRYFLWIIGIQITIFLTIIATFLK